MGFVLHHVPEVVGEAHGVLGFSVGLLDKLRALLFVAVLPVFLLAID